MIGRLQTAVEYASEDTSPWGALKLICGSANLITLAGADRLLLLDLHADAIEGFFDVPTDHLSAHKILAQHILANATGDLAVVAPDAGGAKRAESVAKLLGAPLVFVYKRR